VTCIGTPLVSVRPGSLLTVGAGATLISASWATALGVSRRCVLRTMTPGARLVIGDRAGMSGAVICAAVSVDIGAGTLLGSEVMIVDTDFHNIRPEWRRDSAHDHDDAKPVKIGANVFLGARAIVMKGVEIGANSVIGAGSIVVKSIPANVIAAGNPCRAIRDLSTVGRPVAGGD
jgi:acyl-[acyl carrier protein]--UDP-N-acetylglucosamine O-acyltransferase